jgi:hypothetical protein
MTSPQSKDQGDFTGQAQSVTFPQYFWPARFEILFVQPSSVSAGIFDEKTPPFMNNLTVKSGYFSFTVCDDQIIAFG